MGLYTSGKGNDIIGVGGVVDVHPPSPEYHHPVYCHSVNTGAMSGGRATARSGGDDELVGSGRPWVRAGGDGYWVVGGKRGENGECGGREAGNGRVGGNQYRNWDINYI